QRYLAQLNQGDQAGKLELTIAYIGACPLDKHLKLALRHELDPKDPKGNPYIFGKERKSLKELLLSEPWDYITIQQASLKTPDISTYRPWAQKLCDYVRKYRPDSKILVHETWSYRSDAPLYRDGKTDTHKMYRQLHDAYLTIARELGDLPVIPVGTAFDQARQRPDWQYRPDTDFDFAQATEPQLPRQDHSLNVGWHWGKDRSGKKVLRNDARHANAAGCLLAGMVWREIILGADARKNTFVPEGMTPADAVILRDVAHNVAAEYRR
ncbi:MAG: DUF4886 domain-containing protein, partial [Victivallales bacterium]|nr:DUF4886 domain-containing protein [Victivallales bacterium]